MPEGIPTALSNESTKDAPEFGSSRGTDPRVVRIRELTVTSEAVATTLVDLLRRVTGGKVEADVDGAPFVVIDGERRNLTVHVGPLLDDARPDRSPLREGHLRLWEVRGIPSALARSGWHVSLRDGPHEMIRLGRDVSALTGHVHVSPIALWKLRRLA